MKQLPLEEISHHKVDENVEALEIHSTEGIPHQPTLSTDYGLLYQTNCLTLFSKIKDNQIDCVFADPPFNLGKVYGEGEYLDTLQTKDYLSWSYFWLDECVRTLVPGGALFVYILPQWGYRFAAYLEEQKGLMFRHWIALSMKGTFPRGNKLYPAHYALLYFTKGKPKIFNRVRLPIPICRHCGKDLKDYGGHRKYLNPAGLNLTDFWEDTAPARHKKHKFRWHVNELKPMISSRCFEITTSKEDIVMDPFGGGGSSYQAAQGLKRYWIGSELTDCTPILQRFRHYFPDHIGKKPPEKLFSIFR
ncbi:MAG TPA: site-specific DNA-methyltransferase [Acidobacteriota bacterium]|nr:site-specific DNA-methyltransferase [Acidobacteriota bacterium]